MKKNGTSSKLESGQLAELASAIVRQLPHIEGLGEVAQDWIENGAALRKKLEEALVPQEKKRASGFAESIRVIQIDNLKKRGYSLGFQDVPLPDKDKLQLGLALLVDYDTPIPEQCKLLGVRNYLDLAHYKDLHQKPQDRWGWIYGVEDGTKMRDTSLVNELEKGHRRGLMTVEGPALYRENPDLLKDHFVDLPGSCYNKSRVCVPCLRLWGGQAALCSSWASRHSGRHRGFASCLLE